MIPVSAITYIFVEKKKNSKTLGLKTNKTTSCLKLQNTAIHYAKDNVLYFEYSHTLRYSKCPIILNTLFHTKCTLAYICFLCSCFLNILWIDKQCRPCSEGSFRSSLIRVCTVCICHFVRNFGVQNFRSFTVILPQMIILCISTLHIDHSFPPPRPCFWPTFSNALGTSSRVNTLSITGWICKIELILTYSTTHLLTVIILKSWIP